MMVISLSEWITELQTAAVLEKPNRLVEYTEQYRMVSTYVSNRCVFRWGLNEEIDVEWIFEVAVWGRLFQTVGAWQEKGVGWLLKTLCGDVVHVVGDPLHGCCSWPFLWVWVILADHFHGCCSWPFLWVWVVLADLLHRYCSWPFLWVWMVVADYLCGYDWL